MEQIHIIEQEAVAAFTFQQTEQETALIMQQYVETYGLYKRAFFFEYDECGMVRAIHLVIEALRDTFRCPYKGIDLLHTKASTLIEHFQQLVPYIDDSDAQQGYMYQFPTLGITFWRGNVLTEEDLESERFKEQLPENQEDEKRFLYFETVTFYHV